MESSQETNKKAVVTWKQPESIGWIEYNCRWPSFQHETGQKDDIKNAVRYRRVSHRFMLTTWKKTLGFDWWVFVIIRDCDYFWFLLPPKKKKRPVVIFQRFNAPILYKVVLRFLVVCCRILWKCSAKFCKNIVFWRMTQVPGVTQLWFGTVRHFGPFLAQLFGVWGCFRHFVQWPFASTYPSLTSSSTSTACSPIPWTFAQPIKQVKTWDDDSDRQRGGQTMAERVAKSKRPEGIPSLIENSFSEERSNNGENVICDYLWSFVAICDHSV